MLKGITRNRGRPPEPFFEEMVHEVLQPRLNTPIVFAANKDEPVGSPYLFREAFHRLWRGAGWIFLMHPVEHRQAHLARVNELHIEAPGGKPRNDEFREPDSHSRFAIGSIKDQNIAAHRLHA